MENHGAVMCSVNSVFEAVEQMQMVECMAQKEMDYVIKVRNLTIPGASGKYVLSR